MMARRYLQQLAIPSRVDIARVNAEAEIERRRTRAEAKRLAEVFEKVIEIYARRKKPDDDQRNDQ